MIRFDCNAPLHRVCAQAADCARCRYAVAYTEDDSDSVSEDDTGSRWLTEREARYQDTYGDYYASR